MRDVARDAAHDVANDAARDAVSDVAHDACKEEINPTPRPDSFVARARLIAQKEPVAAAMRFAT